MTQREEPHYDAQKRVQDFNTTYAAQLITIDGYSDEEDDLNNAVTEIEEANDIQAQDNKGQAVNKETLGAAMGESIIMFARRAMVKASRIGNIILAKNLDHPLTYYTVGTADVRISRANATITLINNNLATLTNVTAANVTAMQNSVTAFADVKDTPTIVKLTRKAQGTDQIAPLIEIADKAIDHMGLLIHSYFPGTAMAEEFDLRRKLITVGVRHNIVNFNLEDSVSNSPIINGTAICAYNDRSAESDETGIAELHEIKNGKQSFTVSAAGYITQQLVVDVQRGTTTAVMVKMVAGSNPPPVHEG